MTPAADILADAPAAETAPPGGDAVTVDRFLGGRFHLVQPRKGFRCGSDALVLASVLAPGTADTLVDLGAGPGGVGFAAASRCARLSVWCVERDAAALTFARASLGLPENGAFAGRVRVVEGDIADPPATWSASMPAADVVLMNPPYYPEGTGRRSPDPVRHAARALGSEGLAPWFAAARRLLAWGGLVGVITPASRLADLVCLPSFGALRVYPIQSRVRAPALRVIMTARLGSRAPLTILPALVMHQPCGAFTAGAARLLSGEATLDEVVLEGAAGGG